jgi:hypothetical protein
MAQYDLLSVGGNVANTPQEPISSHAGVQTRDVMADDFGWTVPVETVPIPSEGVVYQAGSPLSNKKTVNIKAMTAKEEDILTSRALIKNGTVIGHLLKSCVTEQGVDVDEMLVGDRNALMVAIRITGYGPDYKADVTCPDCSERSSQTFSLAELEIKRLEIDPVNPGENRFSYTLPVTKKEIHFRFLTGRDEQQIAIENERMQKLFPDRAQDSLVTSRLSNAILSVDGVTDRNKIRLFVEHMPALDSRRLRTFMDKSEPGISMSSHMSCPHCGEGNFVDLPIGVNFFWPRE